MSGTEDELGCSTLTRSSAILHSLSSSPFIALYCDEKLNICSVVPSVSCTMLVMRSILLSRASLWLTYQPALRIALTVLDDVQCCVRRAHTLISVEL